MLPRMPMWCSVFCLALVTILLPGLEAQMGGDRCREFQHYLGSTDELSEVVMQRRKLIDSSSIPQAQLDRVFVALKPKGDGNSMKGRITDTDAGKLTVVNNKEIDSGKPLEGGHFPWHVGITMDGEFFCSGALVSSRHVVTVAHCVRGYTNFTLKLGLIVRTAFETDVLVMSSDNKIAHLGYNENTLANNVALVILPVPIATNGIKIKPVALPKRVDVLKTFAKERAYLTGWGLTTDGSCPNPVLARASVTIMEPSDCWKLFGDVVSSQTMCVSEPNANTCFANDGSPLVYRDPDNTWSLLGLVSFRSDAGCTAGHPLGIMRITSVLAWLSEHTSLSVR